MGAILGVLQITFSLAYAAIVFTGPLDVFLANGFGLVLAGSAVSLLVLALFSGFPGSIGSAQDVPSILLVVMVSSIASLHVATSNPDITFQTIVALMMICCFISAALMCGLGVLKQGKIIRYIPYPVIGGLLAGTGVLLVMLAVNMMTDKTLQLSTLSSLVTREMMLRWLPGVAFALLLLVIQRRVHSPVGVPIAILVCTLLFHLTLWFSGASIDEAASSGFLIQLSENEIQVPFQIGSFFKDIDWIAIQTQIPMILSLAVVSTVILLVQISSIEVAMDFEVDMDRELKINGFSNALIGVFGGIVSFHHISDTILAHRFSAASRITGVVAAVICVIPFFAGSRLLELFPVPILAGIILYLGFDFLYEWLIKAFARLPIWEYIIVVLIFLTLVLVNIPTAIVFGLICGSLLFMVHYSRQGMVTKILYRGDCRSSVMRSEDDEQYLTDEAGKIALVQPKGFLFFGTSSRLFEEAASLLTTEKSQIETLILDFSQVPALDFTGCMGLSRIRRLLESKGVNVLVSATVEKDRPLYEQALLSDSIDRNKVFFDTSDQALEEAENKVLSNRANSSITQSMDSVLLTEGWSLENIDLFKSYSASRTMSDGELLIEAGESSDTIVLIESGTLEVRQERGGRDVRLRVYTPGMVVGEMALYTGGSRVANVFARGNTQVLEISIGSLQKMETCDPALAILLHRFFAKNLATKILDDVRFAHLR